MTLLQKNKDETGSYHFFRASSEGLSGTLDTVTYYVPLVARKS